MVERKDREFPDENLKEKKQTEEKDSREERGPVDEYTGEVEPPAEDAGEVVEVVPVDEGDREGEAYLLEEETAMDTLAADTEADAVSDRITRYTEDEEIAETFEERQKLASGGRDALSEELDEHASKDPDLAGGDIDAAWEDADVAGEEGVGGTAPTPDQDVVDELGEAVGLTYEDDEPLQTEEKFRQRDRDRWELDPASAEDAEEEEGDEFADNV
jgi:hypothetical protein